MGIYCGDSESVLQNFLEDGEIVLKGVDVAGQPFFAVRMKNDGSTAFFFVPMEGKGAMTCMMSIVPGGAMKVEKGFGRQPGVDS